MGIRRSSAPAAPSRDLLGRVYPFFLPILLFLSVTAISRQFAVGFGALCLLLVLGRAPWAALRARAGLLPAAVTVYTAVCLLSGLWSHFGEYAARESIKILIAFAVFLLVLARTRSGGLRRLLWTLNGVLAAVGFLCVEASGPQLLTRGFSALMQLFHSSYPLGAMGYETGVRITGIFSNANVSAGMLAFGLVVSLYLLSTAETEKERLAASLTLGVQALAFFLSFSMGAMAAFAVTCLVYVICAGAGARLPLFLRMVESVAATVVCAFAAYPFLGTGNVLPVLLAFVCGGAIWALDRFAGRPIAAALAGKSRAVALVIGALVAALALYVALAVNLTGSVTLSAGEVLSRAAYPAAGETTVSAQGAAVQATVYSQNASELMMHTNTALYTGPLDGASFTVPEESRVVWFELEGDGVLESVTLSDGTVLPLGYRLLPGFAANRLQGLRANQNFIQRLVFFRDGIALWQKSPVLGWGLGGVEGQLTSVQSFYYESKYIHNQFIQILDEAGVLGLAALVFLLGSALYLLLRRRAGAEPLTAMLAACLTMMFAHSLTEVVWSAQMYQVVVFVLLAVLTMHCGQPEAQSRRGIRWAAAGAMWAIVAVFAALQGCSLLAERSFLQLQEKGGTQSAVVAELQRLDRMDVYNDSTYKINLMANGLQMNSTTGRGIAARCAKELLAKQEFEACYNVAVYYALPQGDWDGFTEAARAAVLQEGANPDAWNGIADVYAQVFDQLSGEDMKGFTASAGAFYDLLTEFNVGRMQPIALTERNEALLSCAANLRDSGTDGEAAYAVIQALLG